MARPRVTVYNEVSLDGRLEGFAADPVRYYRLGFRWRSDAILVGSATAQAFGPPESTEEQVAGGPDVAPVPVHPGFEGLVEEPRPLLVIPDSRGRVRNWRHALAQPWYRAGIALVSAATPAEYLDHLTRRGVDHVLAGVDHVDLAGAFELLHDRHGVRSVRTDAGGTLAGALVAAGLVDEIAVILSPCLAGRPDAAPLVRLPRPLTDQGLPLRLVETAHLDDDALWLRYER